MQITQPQESSSETNFDLELVQKMSPFFGHKSGTTVGRLTVSLLALVPVLRPENDRPPLAEMLKPSEINAKNVICSELIHACNDRPKKQQKSSTKQ